MDIEQKLNDTKESLQAAVRENAAKQQLLDDTEQRILRMQRNLQAMLAKEAAAAPATTTPAPGTKAGTARADHTLATKSKFNMKPPEKAVIRSPTKKELQASSPLHSYLPGSRPSASDGVGRAVSPLQRGGGGRAASAPALESASGASAMVLSPTFKTSSVVAEVMAELDADTSGASELQREVCRKCGKKFLPGYAAHHAKTCKGVHTVQVTAGAKGQPGGGGGGGSSSAGGGDLAQCSYCGLRLYKDAVGDHEFLCRVQRALQARASLIVPDEEISKYATVPPPPMECSVVDVTHESFTVRWANPVFDGGQPIFDFEVQYTLPLGGKIPTMAKDTVLTERLTRWCLDLPIPNQQFRVACLPAATVVRNICVRAINTIGPGAWSPMVSAITTAGTGTVSRVALATRTAFSLRAVCVWFGRVCVACVRVWACACLPVDMCVRVCVRVCVCGCVWPCGCV